MLQLVPLLVIGGGSVAVTLYILNRPSTHDETYGPRRVATCSFEELPSAGLSGPFEVIENGNFGRRYAGPAEGPQPQAHGGAFEEGAPWQEFYTAELADGRETDNQHVYRLWNDGRFTYRLRVGYDGEILATGAGTCTAFQDRFEDAA
ncbi:hypothetical protein ACXN5S_04880 [Pseudoroseicyclus sp. H15]